MQHNQKAMTPSDDPPGEATAHGQSYYNDIDNIGLVDNDRPLICSNPSSYASPPPPSSRGSEGHDSFVSKDDASLGSNSRERGSLGEGGGSRYAIGSLVDSRESSSSSIESIENSGEHYEHNNLSTSALSSDSSSLETRPAKEEQGGNKSEDVHRQAPYYDGGCVEEEDGATGVECDQQPYNHTPSYRQQSQYQQRQQHSTGGAGHDLHSNRGQNLHNHHHDDPLRSSATSGTPSYASTNHSSTPSYHQHHYNALTTPPPPSMPYTNHDPNIANSMNTINTNPYTTPNTNSSTQFNRQESTFTSYAARHAQHYADPVESVTGTTRDDDGEDDDETNTNSSNYNLFCGDENNSLYTQAYPESFVTNPPPELEEDQEVVEGGGGGVLPYPNAHGTHGGGYYGDSTGGHNHQVVDNGFSTGGSNRNRAMEGIAQHLHLASLDGSSQQDHHQEHHQQQFHQMLVKYHHSSLGSGQTTEGLTDEFGEDDNDEGGEEEYGDDDVEEEHYRQLPPPRHTRPPTVQEHALVVVQRGLDPEECTSPTDHRALALRRRDDDESINLSNTDNHHRTPTESPKQKDATPNKSNNKSKQQVAIIKTSKEVVADIKHQLSLHDPTSQHHHQLRDPTSSKYTGYQHCFITVKTQHRFLMLYTFLKRNALNNKIILFFSTTKSTQYYAKLLSRLKFQNVRIIHNGQSREMYLEELFAFSKRENDGGILCVPDFQGQDLAIPPSCSWLVQFEPCSDPSEYIFRVGRISSENKKTTNKNHHHSNNTGTSSTKQSPTEVCRALLFLTPEQFAFLEYYKATKVKFYEYEIPKISKVQKELIKLVKHDARLRKLGSEAYHAYLMAYASHEYRDIYNVHELDSNKVALSFGFEKPPSKVDEDKRSFQETITKREQVRWKPSKKNAEKKKDGTSWMGGTKKSWRYADVHAERMRGSGQNTIAPIGKNVKVPQKNPKK